MPIQRKDRSKVRVRYPGNNYDWHCTGTRKSSTHASSRTLFLVFLGSNARKIDLPSGNCVIWIARGEKIWRQSVHPSFLPSPCSCSSNARDQLNFNDESLTALHKYGHAIVPGDVCSNEKDRSEAACYLFPSPVVAKQRMLVK